MQTPTQKFPDTPSLQKLSDTPLQMVSETPLQMLSDTPLQMLPDKPLQTLSDTPVNGKPLYNGKSVKRVSLDDGSTQKGMHINLFIHNKRFLKPFRKLQNKFVNIFCLI